MADWMTDETLRVMGHKIDCIIKELGITIPDMIADCKSCGGRGIYDESFHGSASWVDCKRCEGTGNVLVKI